VVVALLLSRSPARRRMWRIAARARQHTAAVR
jgi:hypothetical protein